MKLSPWLLVHLLVLVSSSSGCSLFQNTENTQKKTLLFITYGISEKQRTKQWCEIKIFSRTRICFVSDIFEYTYPIPLSDLTRCFVAVFLFRLALLVSLFFLSFFVCCKNKLSANMVFDHYITFIAILFKYPQACLCIQIRHKGHTALFVWLSGFASR